MGTGKTTVGQAVAEKLGKEFIEVDSIIEDIAGKTIPEIFEDDGEIRFRELEIQANKECAAKKNAVFSLGGGAIMNKINMMYMRESSVIICLEASFDEIFKRVMKDGQEKRPMLGKKDAKGAIERLLRFRKPFYDAATPHKVNTTGKSISRISDEIIALYNQYKNTND